MSMTAKGRGGEGPRAVRPLSVTPGDRRPETEPKRRTGAWRRAKGSALDGTENGDPSSPDTRGLLGMTHFAKKRSSATIARFNRSP